jgi:hypothetical protein
MRPFTLVDGSGAVRAAFESPPLTCADTEPKRYAETARQNAPRYELKTYSDAAKVRVRSRYSRM